MAALIATARRNPAKQARGRWVVLWMAGLVLAANGIGGWLLDSFGLHIRFPSAFRVWKEIANGPPPNVLWLGSSRSEGGIRHDVINVALRQRFGRHGANLFNAAVPGGDPYAIELLLDGFLSQGRKPEILILEVSHDVLSRDGVMITLHLNRQATWADVPDLAPQIYRSTRFAQLIHSRLLPLHLHRHQLRLQLADRVRSSLSRGPIEPWGGASGMNPYGHEYDAPPPSPLELASPGPRIPFDPIYFPRVFRDYRIDGFVPAALERVLTRCEREGISVVLVVPAYSRMLRELCTPEVEARFQEYLEGLRRCHAFDYVDLRDSVPDQGFYDLHHMRLDYGGLVYSRVALDRVILPALERHAKKAAPVPTLSRVP